MATYGLFLIFEFPPLLVFFLVFLLYLLQIDVQERTSFEKSQSQDLIRTPEMCGQVTCVPLAYGVSTADSPHSLVEVTFTPNVCQKMVEVLRQTTLCGPSPSLKSAKDDATMSRKKSHSGSSDLYQLRFKNSSRINVSTVVEDKSLKRPKRDVSTVEARFAPSQLTLPRCII